MINANFEPYCEGCPDLEPAAVKYYAGSQVVRTEIYCEHRARCMNIAEHIKHQDQGRRTP